MSARVEMSYRGVGEMLRSAEVRDALRSRADRVLAQAESIAPIGETGDYQHSLHIEESTTDRAVVRVAADVPHAMAVEFRDRVLGRAIDAAGGS